MVLDQHSTLRVVFSIFFGAWTGIIVLLFIATGILLRRAERLRRKQHGSAHP
jgi:hypothetical protein